MNAMEVFQFISLYGPFIFFGCAVLAGVAYTAYNLGKRGSAKKLELLVTWTDGQMVSIPVRHVAHAQQLINRFTYPWIEEAVVLEQGLIRYALKPSGLIEWVR